MYYVAAAKMSEKANPWVKCPTCARKGDWLAGSSGPFCSPRCKLIDLGKWLKEEHVISEPLRPDLFREYEELPPGLDADRPEEENRE